MSPQPEGQQPIIETTGSEKPAVPQTSQDYQAMTEQVPQEERWYTTEGEPTLDVPVVKVDSSNESETADSSDLSERTAPADPGEFDPTTVKPVERRRPKKGMGIKGKIAAVVLTAGLAAGAAGGAVAMGRDGDEKPSGDTTELNATKDNKSEADGSNNSGLDSGVDVPDAKVSEVPQEDINTDATAEQTDVIDDNSEQDFTYSPNTVPPYPGQEAPRVDNETVLPSNPEITDNDTEIEKAVQSVVMLADFFMGNSALTGIEPSIDMENQSIIYQGEGFSVSIAGEISEDGILKQDPLDSMRGFKNIDLYNNGKIVSTVMDKNTGLPAIEVIIEGKAFTTNTTMFKNATPDKALTIGNSQQITKEIRELSTKK